MKQALIIDDNPFNRTLLVKIINNLGFATQEGKNGKEALEKLKDSSFDLIFMDLLMPGMDGYEAVKKIRSMNIRTPIIIVSSITAKEEHERCFEVGANDFLFKPVSVDKIQEIITRYQDYQECLQTSECFENIKIKDKATKIDFSGYSIILVEENNDLASKHINFLRRQNFEVQRALNGDNILEILETQKQNRQKIKIIISNIFFTSGIDGFGLLSKIKRDFLDIFVFLYSQDFDDEIFQFGLQLGADGVFLQEKFENLIIELIENAINKEKQKGSRSQIAITASQVRKAQAQLIKYGCPNPCEDIDIGYLSLTDAGGDWACCNKFNSAGRCGIVLGDVSGHDVMSSYISAISLGIITSNWSKNQKPFDLIKLVNLELNKPDYEKYHVCASALIWDRRRQKINITTAGNPGGLFVENKNIKNIENIKNIIELSGGGMCLGLLDNSELFFNQEIKMNSGDLLFLFSDGIDKEDILNCLKDKDIDLSRQSIRGLSNEILQKIVNNRKQEDDIILVTIKANKEKKLENQISYEFKSSYKKVNEACEWIKLNIANKIPTGHDLDFVMLAIRESLINSVKHGNKFNINSYVDVDAFFEENNLVIQISDEGHGFELPKKNILDIDRLQIGGRGLPCIYSIANKLETKGGTILINFTGGKK